MPKPAKQENDFPAGLAQPALRALNGMGIQNLSQLSKFSESEIRELHGIGPNALNKLRDALEAMGLGFKGGK
jgi:hypothetical protein